MSDANGMPAVARSSGSVRNFLAARLNGAVEMGPDLPQGAWCRAYAFRWAGRDLVVRFNPSRDAFDIDVLANRFASDVLPIPTMLEVGEIEGGFYAISERAFGDFLEELPPETMREVLPSVLDVLDSLREADTSASVGFGPWDLAGNGTYPSWAEYLVGDVRSEPAFRSGWRDRLKRSKGATVAFQAGMEALDSLAIRCPDRSDLVHSDLLNRNVFVSGGRITALIDWQCALHGDFLYDLAWLTFWAPWHPGVAAVDFRQQALDHYERMDLVVPGFDDRLRCYEVQIGLRHLIYNAWRGDPANLDATARRTMEVIA